MDKSIGNQIPNPLKWVKTRFMTLLTGFIRFKSLCRWIYPSVSLCISIKWVKIPFIRIFSKRRGRHGGLPCTLGLYRQCGQARGPAPTYTKSA